MSSVFVDRFNRPDNSDISNKSPMGVSYTEIVDDMQVVSGSLKAINLANHQTICGLVMDSTDYYLQSSVTTQTGFASGAGLMIRWVDSSNYYYARINTFAQDLKLYKVIGGVQTQLGSTYSGGYTQGSSYTLKINIVGSVIDVYVNDVLRVSAVDASISTAGKPGFWTDYGNSTFNDFVVVGNFTITPPTISSDYSQYQLPSNPLGWRLNSIDMQIVTKSESWTQDQTKRLNELQAIKDTGVNYVSFAVPYDNLTKYTDYVADARTKGLKVYHRSHWDAWEGDNSIPTGLNRQDYLTGIYHFIINNPTLYEDYDLCGVAVEPSNANDHGNYTFRTPELPGGTFDYSKYNQFLKDCVAYANAAFTVIGKRVITFPMSISLSTLNLNGQVLDSGDGGNASGLSNADIVQYFGGVLCIDHYMSDSYRATNDYGAKYASDLDKIHIAFPDCRILIGEIGFPLVSSVFDSEQFNTYKQIIRTLLNKPYILGVNFWVHMASNTASLFNDSSGTITIPGRIATVLIKESFQRVITRSLI